MEKAFCPRLSLFSVKKGERAAEINRILKLLYPHAECALNFRGDPFRLLVMARLSAQCTDQRVNEVSEKLFVLFPDVYAFAEADLSRLEEAVRPCGLFRTKAHQIREMSRVLLSEHGGKVPAEKDALLKLPGVGEKIANLMMGDVFGDPQIVADTHCIRLAARFRLTDSQNPRIVTRDLEKIIPKEDQSDFCHRIILLGREYCKAQRPLCDRCPLKKRPTE